jgi:acyl-CoA:acyl-CoA alkyltransferase
MRIAGIAASYPTNVVSNEAIVEKVLEQSAESFVGDLEHLRRALELQFEWIGSRERRVLERGEPALPYILESAREAIRRSQIRAEEIDLVIYGGVGRGFLEPAMAYVVADALELQSAHCFDVLEACMSWTRAMFIAETLLKARAYRCVLVVTGELVVSHALEVQYRIEKLTDLKYRFLGFTLGDAATATVVAAEGQDWSFDFFSVPAGQNLCYVPLPWSADYAVRPKLPSPQPFTFYAHYDEMMKVGAEQFLFKMSRAFRRTFNDGCPVDRIFCHADQIASYRSWAKSHGAEEKLYQTFREHGNCAASSVPLGMANALRQGKLERGDRTALMVVSSGIACALVTFEF